MLAKGLWRAHAECTCLARGVSIMAMVPCWVYHGTLRGDDGMRPKCSVEHTGVNAFAVGKSLPSVSTE